ncbi:MAG: COX15/CtaA family protein [Acetobacteraceae bacterium]|nr:COX15/CtaA family protein [Acetobacteraceae bacterium]
MPFDVQNFPGASPQDRAATRRSRRLVAAWLFAVAAMVLMMIVLGGLTRLTGSGLSIMEWAPLGGALPPVSDAEWRRLFDLYRQIPQYSLVNEGFGLEGFKHIFWLEWIHRLWGRLIGLAFVVPLILFWIKGRLNSRLKLRLILLLLLGGLQGAIGWFMVASGFFPEATAVSPYRLVAHLGMALLLYSVLIWTGLTVLRPAPQRATAQPLLRLLSVCCFALVVVTIIAGGFVAGTHAGMDYNTFPLMDGRLLPVGYSRLEPFARNLTENIAAVQFDHRALATLVLVAITTTAVIGFAAPRPAPVQAALTAFVLSVLAQYPLGVATLLLIVPADLATAHQVGAFLVLAASILLLHALRRVRIP